MQKNDFEKNVQQRMDELQLYPSAEVWPEVERRIRKEKKRRWFVFWFLFPLLLTGAGVAIYFLSKTEEKKSNRNNNQQQIQQPVSEINRKDSLLNGQPVTTVVSRDSSGFENEIMTVSVTNRDTQKENTEISKIRPVKNGEPVFSFEKKKEAKRNNNLFTKTKSPPSLIEKKGKIILANTVTTEQQPMIVGKLQDKPPQVITDTTNKSLVQVNETKTPDDIVLADQTKPMAIVADTSADSNKPAPLTKKNADKWKLGITLITGLSNRIGGLFSGGQKNYYVSALSTSPAQFASFTGDISKPGLFWEAGVYIQNNSKKKTNVSVGLSVSSFSYRQPTGPFQDSVISADANGFYRPGNSLLYNNRYYYLQIPLMIHWRVNKGNKFPMVWQNGLSPSFLLGSNALIYNYSRNIYYRDEASLNKVQLAFRSGLYARFASASRHPLSAGLFFNYNLGGFQKTFEYDRNHLLSFGVQFMLQFKKD